MLHNVMGDPKPSAFLKANAVLCLSIHPSPSGIGSGCEGTGDALAPRAVDRSPPMARHGLTASYSGEHQEIIRHAMLD